MQKFYLLLTKRLISDVASALQHLKSYKYLKGQ